MKKITFTIVFLFVAMLTFSNVNDKETNKKINSENEIATKIIEYTTTYSTINYEINNKTLNLFCSYHMTSSYMGGPAVTRTIYCNPGDNQSEQREAVHRLAQQMWVIFYE